MLAKCYKTMDISAWEIQLHVPPQKVVDHEIAMQCS